MINDEPAFAARLGPELTITIKRIAKVMCNHTSLEEDGESCTCATDGGSCIAFGMFGDLALAVFNSLNQDVPGGR